MAQTWEDITFAPCPEGRDRLGDQVTVFMTTLNLRVEITDLALKPLRAARYALCIAPIYTDIGANVVWFATTELMSSIELNWSYDFRMFVSLKSFVPGDIVSPGATSAPINLGQQCTFGQILSVPSGGTRENAFTLNNASNSPVSAGISQSISVLDSNLALPSIVTPHPGLPGKIYLTPARKILLWFSVGAAIGSMFDMGEVEFPANMTIKRGQKPSMNSCGIVLDYSGVTAHKVTYNNYAWEVIQ